MMLVVPMGFVLTACGGKTQAQIHRPTIHLVGGSGYISVGATWGSPNASDYLVFFNDAPQNLLHTDNRGFHFDIPAEFWGAFTVKVTALKWENDTHIFTQSEEATFSGHYYSASTPFLGTYDRGNKLIFAATGFESIYSVQTDDLFGYRISFTTSGNNITITLLEWFNRSPDPQFDTDPWSIPLPHTMPGVFSNDFSTLTIGHDILCDCDGEPGCTEQGCDEGILVPKQVYTKI